MNEFVGSWIRGIATAAIITGIAMAATPPGRIREVMKMTCGVVMILAIISPLLGKQLPGLSVDLSKYRQEAAELAQSAWTESSNLDRSYIEGKCAAYISEKAAAMGIDLSSVRVIAEWSGEGCWYPDEVHIVSDVSTVDKSAVSAIIESELGIPEEKQIWGLE